MASPVAKRRNDITYNPAEIREKKTKLHSGRSVFFSTTKPNIIVIRLRYNGFIPLKTSQCLAQVDINHDDCSSDEYLKFRFYRDLKQTTRW